MSYANTSLTAAACLASKASQASQAAVAWLVRLPLVRRPVVHRLVAVAWLLQLPLQEVAHGLAKSGLLHLTIEEVEEVVDTQVAQVAETPSGQVAETPSGKVVVIGAKGGSRVGGKESEVLGSEPEAWKAWDSQASQASQATSRCKASHFRCPGGFCRDCGQKPCSQNNCPL